MKEEKMYLLKKAKEDKERKKERKKGKKEGRKSKDTS